MKKNNILIAIVLVALCVIGWFALLTQKVSQGSAYNTYVKQADEWVERGLYQRAIANYNLALEEKNTEDVYEKIAKAYKARYEEAPKATIEDYTDFLEDAVVLYPANKILVDNLVELYKIESKHSDIYQCVSNAIDNGYDTEEIRVILREAKYAYELRRSEFSGLKQSLGQYYSAARNNGWNVYSKDEGYLLETDYVYVGSCSEDGTVLVTGEDSRIIDGNGVVLGIFEEKITDAGIMSEGLIAATTGQTYSYYNDLAEKQFGDYEEAGAFQNGKAAVKKDGKWMLINDKGENESELYEEIVLDLYGRYIVNDRILIKTSNGKYQLCDEKLKKKATLDCTDIDVYTEDKLIAVCQDGKWGYMNDDGKIVIKPTYSDAKSFSNGLAAVCQNGKWGFIDAENNLVIDYQFTEVGYLNAQGICPVRTDDPNEASTTEKTESEDKSAEKVQEEQIWKLLELEIAPEEE